MVSIHDIVSRTATCNHAGVSRDVLNLFDSLCARVKGTEIDAESLESGKLLPRAHGGMPAKEERSWGSRGSWFFERGSAFAAETTCVELHWTASRAELSEIDLTLHEETISESALYDFPSIQNKTRFGRNCTAQYGPENRCQAKGSGSLIMTRAKIGEVSYEYERRKRYDQNDHCQNTQGQAAFYFSFDCGMDWCGSVACNVDFA